METVRLDREKYAGKKFTVRYKTNGYYDICASENGFALKYVPFEVTAEKSFDDEFSANGLMIRSRSVRLKTGK